MNAMLAETDFTEPGRAESDALARAAQLARAGALADAASVLAGAVAAEPTSVPATVNLAAVHQALAAPHAAFDVLVRALARMPERAELHYAMAGVLRDLGDAEQAIVACDEALRLQPGWADAYNRLGQLHEHAGRPLAALLAYNAAAAAAPTWHGPRHNQATMFTRMGRYDEAEAALRASLALAPDFAPSHNDLAALLLTDGRYDEGWPHYEWRFGAAAPPMFPGSTAPVWNGEPLAGGVVMVWIEQGLGDHLQFARCVRTIRARGGRCWLQVPPPLMDLYRSLADVERLVRHDEVVEGYDWQIPLLSLAQIAGAPDGDEVASVPYLRAPPLTDVQRAALAAHDDGPLDASPLDASTFKVGIVWASLRSHPAAARRDCPLAALLPLADVPGVRLYSLQFGDEGRALAGANVVDLGPVLGDFAQTAALVEAMDLVITVDTAMAHLAGALGKPVWLLVGEPADWRWQRERDDSPWYPTMRLFRQREPGEWGEVIARVSAALHAASNH